MNWETILALLVGGTGIGGWISSILTRQSQKESNEVDLLDRAYKEITRLDKIIDKLKLIISNLETKVKELEEMVSNYEKQLKERNEK